MGNLIRKQLPQQRPTTKGSMKLTMSTVTPAPTTATTSTRRRTRTQKEAQKHPVFTKLHQLYLQRPPVSVWICDKGCTMLHISSDDGRNEKGRHDPLGSPGLLGHVTNPNPLWWRREHWQVSPHPGIDLGGCVLSRKKVTDIRASSGATGPINKWRRSSNGMQKRRCVGIDFGQHGEIVAQRFNFLRH